MYSRFTEHHGLHNLIWVCIADVSRLDWYPGDHLVDVVGLDIYNTPGASNDNEWEVVKAEYEGVKLIALSETGPIVVPAAIKAYKTMWSWFNTWDVNGYNITVDELNTAYHDPVIVTLDRVPNWKSV